MEPAPKDMAVALLQYADQIEMDAMQLDEENDDDADDIFTSNFIDAENARAAFTGAFSRIRRTPARRARSNIIVDLKFNVRGQHADTRLIVGENLHGTDKTALTTRA